MWVIHNSLEVYKEGGWAESALAFVWDPISVSSVDSAWSNKLVYAYVVLSLSQPQWLRTNPLTNPVNTRESCSDKTSEIVFRDAKDQVSYS